MSGGTNGSEPSFWVVGGVAAGDPLLPRRTGSPTAIASTPTIAIAMATLRGRFADPRDDLWRWWRRRRMGGRPCV